MRRLLLTTTALLAATAAYADPRTDCPPTAQHCKVVVLTDQEAKVLLDQNGILATAAIARKLDLGDLAAYFREKIEKAPAGDVAKPAEPPKDTPKK